MENELLKAIFNSVLDGILVLDDNLKIINFNKTAQKILGLSKKEIIKKDIEEIFENYNLVYNCLKDNVNYKRQDCKFNINENKIRCVSNITSIQREKKVIGVVILFSDTRHIHKVVNNVVGYNATYNFQDIITKNPYMKKVIAYAKKASNTDCNIFLQGSSGTGKEVFAQSIHNYSSRSKGPFVAINCAAIPRELFESELFGYEKGAFTGARTGGYPGKFELAEGGTIFLDEIGELPLDIQSKLLRVLDNHKIVRVGSTHEKKIDVRIISATNRDLLQEVNNKNFRYDLYYRLNVIEIFLLDLKDREEDIEELSKYFIKKMNKNNLNSCKKIESDALKVLKEYTWDGNVRELRNILEKAYHLCDDEIITEKYMLYLLKNKSKTTNDSFNENVILKKEDIIPLKDIEKKSIKKALIACNKNAEEAAKLLGISRATIYRKINKYKINVDNI